MREINREIVSALIFSSDNKLLMGKKDPNKGGVYSDCWHIPGGGVNQNEEMEDALQREVLEETGLVAEKIKLVDNIGRGDSEKTLKDTGEKVLCHMKFNVYRVDLDQKAEDIQLVPSDDLIELKWFSESELKDIKLTPPSEELFKRICKNLL